ncbi:uncharacterized protein LOC134196729 [Corticium candelabrum]|uniref:uncharacterized protein LOC134196729 n=1 Tax=Corticium candelabrum TaxID=121492 RepID=UPI002E25A72B|nr:uncharacterized protein LOC134196729 [Corticium candelabrum]
MELKPLRDSVKCLLQERSLLEQHLKSIQARRVSANGKLEQVNFRMRQMAEKSTKVAESLGMALQKVDQTQLEILKLGDLTDSNRKRLEDLHRFAEEERVCQANDVIEFEQVMAALTDKFRSAPKIYSDILMQTELSMLSQKQAAAKETVDKKRQSVEETREKLEKILDRNDKLRAVSEIEDDTWKIVVDMLQDERSRATSELAVRKQKLEELQI